MNIKRSSLFKEQFKEIIFYIAQDKKYAAKNFKDKLNKEIDNLIHFPYKYRTSYYYNDINIRDMIFEGYTIVYRINKNTIEILEIFNKNKPVEESI